MKLWANIKEYNRIEKFIQFIWSLLYSSLDSYLDLFKISQAPQENRLRFDSLLNKGPLVKYQIIVNREESVKAKRKCIFYASLRYHLQITSATCGPLHEANERESKPNYSRRENRNFVTQSNTPIHSPLKI